MDCIAGWLEVALAARTENHGGRGVRRAKVVSLLWEDGCIVKDPGSITEITKSAGNGGGRMEIFSRVEASRSFRMEISIRTVKFNC